MLLLQAPLRMLLFGRKKVVDALVADLLVIIVVTVTTTIIVLV